MGQYLDNFIQPAVQQTKAYLKDTKHVLQLLETIPALEGTLLVTADISSHFTIVQHHQPVILLNGC